MVLAHTHTKIKKLEISGVEGLDDWLVDEISISLFEDTDSIATCMLLEFVSIVFCFFVVVFLGILAILA